MFAELAAYAHDFPVVLEDLDVAADRKFFHREQHIGAEGNHSGPSDAYETHIWTLHAGAARIRCAPRRSPDGSPATMPMTFES
jgi:hypothetical protein